MPLDRIRIVLVRPRNAGNVGATARAMKNMGVRHLVVVAARGEADRHGHLSLDDATRAREMAVHADDVLAAARHVSTLQEAVADCGLVVGTTSRPTARPEGECAPRDAAARIIAAAATNDVAIVFGPENHGLSVEEVACCQQVLSIPASTAYASLNLAQAVLLVTYEMFLASGVHAPRPANAHAPNAQLELMYAKLEEALRRVGFLQSESAPHMMRTLRGLFGRAGLDEREVRVCLGLARQVAWAASFCPADRPGEVPDPEEAPLGART